VESVAALKVMTTKSEEKLFMGKYHKFQFCLEKKNKNNNNNIGASRLKMKISHSVFTEAKRADSIIRIALRCHGQLMVDLPNNIML
jgi:hypothetical protein